MNLKELAEWTKVHGTDKPIDDPCQAGKCTTLVKAKPSGEGRRASTLLPYDTGKTNLRQPLRVPGDSRVQVQHVESESEVPKLIIVADKDKPGAAGYKLLYADGRLGAVCD